ncbi:L,D-transpeptidase [bacterium]|nr:L,D-transpeptidase [bacterium]
MKALKIYSILASLTLVGSLATASTVSEDPMISEQEALELTESEGSDALRAYEEKYGALTEEQKDQFLAEQEQYERSLEEDFLSGIEAQFPTSNVDLISSNKSGKIRLKLKVSVSKQRMTVYLDGKPVSGLSNIKISTGKKGHSTKRGTYSLRGKEVVKKRINRTFTKRLGRKVYLEDAVHIYGGVFFHKASTAAQKNTLGKAATHGCVRVDRNVSGKFFSIVKKYRDQAEANIH